MISELIEQLFRNITRGSERPERGPLFGHPVRFGERVFVGEAATGYAGTDNKLNGATFMGAWDGAFGAFWLERSAQFASISFDGGIGIYGAARKSDRVPETAPIGVAGAVLSDLDDGTGAWAGYFEAVRTPEGGTTYGVELDVGNEGANVVSLPYQIAPHGATIGHWIAAGRSLLGSTPANPSAAAIVIGRNNQTWNAALVFAADGISPGGYALKLANKTEHAFGWFNSVGQVVSLLYSVASSNAQRVAQVFGNGRVDWFVTGARIASDESAAPAGVQPTDYVRRIGFAGAGYAEVRAQNASNGPCDLLLAGGNGGKVRFGVLQPVTVAEAVTGYIEVKDASGAVRKLAVIG